MRKWKCKYVIYEVLIEFVDDILIAETFEQRASKDFKTKAMRQPVAEWQLICNWGYKHAEYFALASISKKTRVRARVYTPMCVFSLRLSLWSLRPQLGKPGCGWGRDSALSSANISRVTGRGGIDWFQLCLWSWHGVGRDTAAACALLTKRLLLQVDPTSPDLLSSAPSSKARGCFSDCLLSLFVQEFFTFAKLNEHISQGPDHLLVGCDVSYPTVHD